MRGSYTQHLIRTSRLSDAVERAQAIRKEEAEVRLARIQNGKEPSHINGPWPSQEKGKPME